MESSRPARAGDLGRIAELARMAVTELTPMRGGAVWRAGEARFDPMEPELNKLLDDEDRLVLVATLDEAIMGYAVGAARRLHDGSLLGVITDIFVEEGARSIGLGEAMLDDLISWCRGRGCIGIDSMALPGHRSTKNFFEEAGFTARQLIMHKHLSPPDPSASA
ncbi:MAG: GNAT family N-acetyltransferase [Acidimicrobiales bacterium]